jgi:tetratricopeptide (TPR) repeat protein
VEGGAACAAVARAEGLLLEGKARAAASALEKALSDARLEDGARARAVVLLARAQRLDGKAQKAVETLERPVTAKAPEHFIELAEARLELKAYAEALRAADNHAAGDPANILTSARWARARALFGLSDYLRCVEACIETMRLSLCLNSEDSPQRAQRAQRKRWRSILSLERSSVADLLEAVLDRKRPVE